MSDARPIYEQYCDDVLNGHVIVGMYIHLAVARFRSMCADPRYIYRRDKVERVISFFGTLKHFEGKHAGHSFTLEPWQAFVCAGIYGLYHADSGLRVVTNVYLEIARKNGKTAFAAGLCLYHLIADGEASAEVYLAANSKDQAKVAFKFVNGFSSGVDPKHQILTPLRDSVTIGKTTSMCKVLAADSTKLDGPNPSMYLLDEYHAAKDTDLRDVLKSGQGMREQPMEIITTTAGFDKLAPCYTYRTTCTEVLAGAKTQDHLFVVIFSLDAGDDWHDERKWQKANPNLGITVRTEYLRKQVQDATNTSTMEVGVRTKNFNEWCDAAEVWIPDSYVVNSVHHEELEKFRDLDAWGGIDLSSTSDLGCFALMIPHEGKLWFWVHYFLPQAALTEHRFRVLYSEWYRQGFLTLTPGNVTDYDYILNYVKELSDIVIINAIAYDSWNATQFVINATDAGLPMEPFSQTLGSFNRPTKEFERLMKSGCICIDDNEINRHCIRNVVMARDRNGNTKPSKQYEEKKIDGVIGMLEALGQWLLSPRYEAFV